MRWSRNKRLLPLAMLGLALLLSRSVVASAAETTAKTTAQVTVAVPSNGTGVPERTYDNFTVTQVRRDGETLTITGVLTNGRPQERANVQMRIPVESRPLDPRWQRLYERQRDPTGE
jgi:hypothetical protein